MKGSQGKVRALDELVASCVMYGWIKLFIILDDWIEFNDSCHVNEKLQRILSHVNIPVKLAFFSPCALIVS